MPWWSLDDFEEETEDSLVPDLSNLPAHIVQSHIFAVPWVLD